MPNTKPPPSLTGHECLQVAGRLALGVALIATVAGAIVLAAAERSPEDVTPMARVGEVFHRVEPIFEAQKRRCVQSMPMWENVSPSLFFRHSSDIEALALRRTDERVYLDVFLSEMVVESFGGLRSRIAVPQSSVLTFEVSCDERSYVWRFRTTSLPEKYLPPFLQEHLGHPEQHKAHWM